MPVVCLSQHHVTRGFEAHSCFGTADTVRIAHTGAETIDISDFYIYNNPLAGLRPAPPKDTHELEFGT